MNRKKSYNISRFCLAMAASVGLLLLGIILGGWGNHPTTAGLIVLSIAVAGLGLSTLLGPYQTLQAIAGFGLLLYGLWWIIMPNIETSYNLMTVTLIGTGAFTLFYSYTHPPKYPVNARVLIIFLIGLGILAAVVIVIHPFIHHH